MASVELFTEYNTHDLGCVLCGELLQDVGAVKFDGARRSGGANFSGPDFSGPSLSAPSRSMIAIVLPHYTGATLR